ncbi:serine/threonine protein kinase [Paenibacillus sp. 1011MAR3C5]|uniref:serine/threonine protein kinase n=1 Tax=Paenibacillus sp. 1011MAR3C5 TaxID=1675787 RepID=UPI000E6BD88B|nr:serine/threonine-protein kinase [Paenibacillus sp. 1011MAR3C5]RJE90181.1 serine/threonine protein kinase [Paenibacillus sp. 1011MAR3C5]
MMNNQAGSELLKNGTIVEERYRVIRVIGQGGMGIVYAVEDLKLEGTVRAMKITSSSIGSGIYSEEAHTLMKLSHPYLPLITDYFPPQEGGGREVLIMDYVDGNTIASMLNQSMSGFTFPELIHIGLQLCSALVYLHSRPSAIIHRDLKPSNVMIDRKGNIKLIDFGISRRYKEGQHGDTVKLGTLGFAAPEQRDGRQSDARTDIYGLGALLYYIASNGVRTYDGDSGGYRSIIPHLPKDFPASFGTVLERMLQPTPAHRYQSMLDVEQALKAFSSQAVLSDDAPKRWDMHMNRIKPALVSVISMSPGAGATMLSITLSTMLGRRGCSVTAAEYYGVQPEWIELLPARSKRDSIDENGLISYKELYNRRKKDSNAIHWCVVPSHQLSQNGQDSRLFEQKLRQFGSDMNIIDFSSKWHEPDALYWLMESMHVIAVGDPFIAKWQVDHVQRLIELDEKLKDSGGTLHWVANKDVRFRARTEWLSLFPSRPVCTIPLLPQDAVLNALWSNKWMTENTVLDYRLGKALTPLCDRLTRHLDGNGNS